MKSSQTMTRFGWMLILSLTWLVLGCGSGEEVNNYYTYSELDGDSSLPVEDGDDTDLTDDDDDDADDDDDDGDCEAGTLGCSCFPNSTCLENLECATDGLCREPSCQQGEEGCDCYQNGTCNATTDSGAELICDEGTCVASDCIDGAEGCKCLEGEQCNEGLICEQGLCEALGCLPGTIGCICDDGACLAGNAICTLEGWCEIDTCPVGSEGCACTEDNRCGTSSRGEDLLCDAGVCVAPSCTPGERGCVCLASDVCNNPTDQCVHGFCQPEGCVPGELNCPCAGGSCQQGLSCRDDSICVDNTGYLGGPCFDNGRCQEGNRCMDGVCYACNLGSEACGCNTDTSCNPGLECYDDLCVVQGSVEPMPPDSPVCYTPCERDLVLADGTYKECPSDRLMEGCLDGQDCINGSCTQTGEEPENTCDADTDCPEFQTCIRGQCYSDCSNDTDCPSETACHKHVCRVICSNEDDGCGEGTSCVSQDGQNGYCLPVAEPGGEESKSVNGSFELSQRVLEFSNVNTVDSLRITNNAATFETFLVRKRSHRLYLADGSSTEENDPYGDEVECDPMQDCPLVWLQIGEQGDAQSVQYVEIGVEGNGGEVQIEITGADGSSAVRWDGVLEVIHPRFGTQTITISYSESPEGQWAGNILYYSNFRDDGLDAWRTERNSDQGGTLLRNVQNALVRRWGAFRGGNLSWESMQAALTATETESWNWPSVTEDCPAQDGACYMHDDNELGLVVYTSDRNSNPVPTGVTKLPMAMNLRPDDADSSLMTGRIESRKALQYVGNPAVSLRFLTDAADCDRTVGGVCLAFLDEFDAEVYVGGRYNTDSSDTTCRERGEGQGYELTQIPWLLSDFPNGSEVDDASGLRYHYECRDSQIPYNDGSETLEQDLLDTNISMAASNPVPNGKTLRRSIRLVDGALINQSMLFIIFEETFDSFLPDREEPFRAYGTMILRRQAVDLDDADENENGLADVYEGSVPVDDRDEPEDILAVSCSPEMIQDVLGYGNDSMNGGNVNDLMVGLIDGVVPSPGGSTFIDETSDEDVHYLCVANGLFDGGPGAVTGYYGGAVPPNDNTCGDSANLGHYADNDRCDDGGPGAETSICPLGTDRTDCGVRRSTDADARIPCPAGSEVIFFTVDALEMSQADLADEACQQDVDCDMDTGRCSEPGFCQDTLNAWRQSGDVLIQVQPTWRCEDENEIYCDGNRLDLRDGKNFYPQTEEQAVFNPMYSTVDDAFRYKTRFRSRDGDTIGFAPVECVPNSNQEPYCYDPEQIKEAEERVDCLLGIWQDYYDDLTEANKDKLNEYLCTNFSYAEACHPSLDPDYVHDGFERLNAELLVMMGDEAYTKAFASRYDLANSNAVSFEGSLFEPGGINLSGAAGYEMYSLYKAVQYYQKALDRFYSMSPIIWRALEYQGSGRNFVTPETVVWYFERLTRASTQRARAWSQVAERYNNFNRADLAWLVVERAYTATYMESVILSQLMVDITNTLSPEDRPQIVAELETVQKRYRAAMLDMRSMYESITSQLNYFGFAPDYIPFPTLGPMDQNAFEVILVRARNKMSVAKERENTALSQNRSFETDAAEFQAELVRLRNNYESQLGEICGTFEGSDGRIYPAVSRYAYLNDDVARYGDPCGLVGNGTVYEAMGQFEMTQIGMQQIRAQYDSLIERVEIERSRVSAQCDRIVDLADYVYDQAGETISLEEDIAKRRFAIGRVERAMSVAAQLSNLSKCTVGFATDCPTAAVALGIYVGVTVAGEATVASLEAQINDKEQEISEINRDTAYWQTLQECDAAMIDSNARMAEMLVGIKEIELEALRADYNMRLALSEIQQQLNKAKRLEQELSESEQQTINIQAAKNDPNVRIYRNDAYINADLSFQDVLKETYRATRVYEYYTSQSYAELDKLFLIRMVQYGDYNLENYLTDLENAFYDFEEEYGLPDTRVAIVSLRDDILAIPRLDDEGRSLTQNERINQMRATLTDASLLDKDGYLSIPFTTNFLGLSPLTRNHKIDYIEAEIIGSSVGDTVGRLYLKPKGTSVIKGVDGLKNYYRFPERTAVINPFFNGNRIFTADVYKNQRLRDRPFVNTSWNLILNQRDELANQDIDLNAVTDIRLYVYYTDFTAL